jgi:putative heme iron utilization protein
MKGEMRHVYRSLMRKAEGKIPLGRPRRGWYNIKMDLGEIAWEVD